MKRQGINLLFLLVICSLNLRTSQGVLIESFEPPLDEAEYIIIKGSTKPKRVAQIRLHSEDGSCDDSPQIRAAQGLDPLACNPLVLKIKARRHKVYYYRKGRGKDNTDQLLKISAHPTIDVSKLFSIKITVTSTGYDIKVNDEETETIRTQKLPVYMVRALSGDFIEITRGHLDIPINEPNCGLPSVTKSWLARIVGGQNAEPGQYPWQAALRRKSIYPWAPYPHICGGSLISSCWVATAAHCVTTTLKRDKGSYEIRVGDYYNGENESLYGIDEDVQTFSIKEFYIHPNYTFIPTPRNDIALIKLKPKNGKCAVYSNYVKPICLPEPTVKFSEGGTCHISGWGAKNWTDVPREYPHVLQYGKILMQDTDGCRELYGPDPVYNMVQITAGMLCAGKRGIDTCQGDSGGPLSCPIEDTPYKTGPFVLWGITSWGEGCANTKKPGVYTKVADFIPWISKVRGVWNRKNINVQS